MAAQRAFTCTEAARCRPEGLRSRPTTPSRGCCIGSLQIRGPLEGARGPGRWWASSPPLLLRESTKSPRRVPFYANVSYPFLDEDISLYGVGTILFPSILISFKTPILLIFRLLILRQRRFSLKAPPSRLRSISQSSYTGAGVKLWIHV